MSEFTLTSHMGQLTIHHYDRAAMAFFSIVGLLMQLPVILVYGYGRQVNVPITIMSSWYIYFDLSNFISAVAWTSNSPESWWSGAGWCDMDVRLRAAGGIAVLIVQCVTNYKMSLLLSDQPRTITPESRRKTNIMEAIVCMALPTCVFVLITFTTYNRFDVVQYAGCTMNGDTSPATIVVYLIWLPILSISCLVTFAIVVIKFAKRGKTAALETVSFIADMTPMQFIRLVIFGCVMTLVVCPLSMYVGIWNLVAVGNAGVTKAAWAHGKPDGWGITHRATWDQLVAAAQASGTNVNPLMGLTMAIKIINVALSWILFLCYGTGGVAMARYRDVAEWLHLVGPRKARKTSKENPAMIETNMCRETSAPYDAHVQMAMERLHPELVEHDLKWAHLMYPGGEPQSASTQDTRYEKSEDYEQVAVLRSLSLDSTSSEGQRSRYAMPMTRFFGRG